MRGPLTLALLFAAAAASGAGGDTAFEKTIPVPRTADARLGWTHGKCKVDSVTLRNYPDSEEIEEARAKDRDDKTWLWWEFNVENRADRKCRIRLSVEVLDRKGNVVKASDRSGSVSPGEWDDDIRVSTLMKTLDIADAPKVRLRAEIRLQ